MDSAMEWVSRLSFELVGDKYVFWSWITGRLALTTSAVSASDEQEKGIWNPCRKRYVGIQRRDAVNLPSLISRVTSSVTVIDFIQRPQQEWLSWTRVLPLAPQQNRVTSLGRLRRVSLTELANLEQGLAGPGQLVGHNLMQRWFLSLGWGT